MDVVRTIGKLPEPWWDMWEERGQFFDDDENFLPGQDILEGAGYGRSGFESHVTVGSEGLELPVKYAKVLVQMLERVLRYKVEERPSAEEMADIVCQAWGRE